MRTESSGVQSAEDADPTQEPDVVDADANETGDTDDMEIDDFEPPTEFDDDCFAMEDKTEEEIPMKKSHLKVFEKIVSLKEKNRFNTFVWIQMDEMSLMGFPIRIPISNSVPVQIHMWQQIV